MPNRNPPQDPDQDQANVANNNIPEAAAVAVGGLSDPMNMVSASDTNIHSSSEEDEGDSSGDEYYNTRRKGNGYNRNDDPAADFMYSSNLDEEDEAWVYRNMRGGLEENVTMVSSTQSQQPVSKSIDAAMSNISQGGTNKAIQQPPLKQKRSILKPRDSDAVLSCPCCLNVVCMDCQAHEKYTNQYRAMFVMNIGVDWTKCLYYDEKSNSLISKKMEINTSHNNSSISLPVLDVPEDGNEDSIQLDSGLKNDVNTIPMVEDCTINTKTNSVCQLEECGDEETSYFSVHCANCRTEIAALDMTDEIYHFYGCIAS